MAPTREPDPSFAAKLSRDERTYFGDPTEAAPARESEDHRRKALVADLLKGGGAAVAAADELIALADPKTREPLGEIAAHPRRPADVRAAACRVLGRLGDEGSVRFLAAAIRADDATVRDAAAAALGTLALPAALAPLAESVDAEWRVFEDKTVSGDRMHYSDFEVLLGSFAIRARALAAIGDGAGVRPIRGVIVAKVLGGAWQVAASERAGQDPARPKRACGLAVAEALETLGGEDAVAALGELADAMRDDPSVAGRCRAAIAKLGAGGR